jgi:flagellar hook-associated protein 1
VTGTFSSLSTALSALQYNRLAMDVHSGNVANVGTDGYVRRRALGETVGAPSVPAIWSRYDGAGDGVRVSSIERMTDPLVDARVRTEHGEQFLLDGRAEALSRLESGLGEPGDNGVAGALTAYWSAWHDVANNPGDSAARSQLLARADALTGALAGQARVVGTEWSDQRTKLDAAATEVNTIAGDLARLNETIRTATKTGSDTNTLADRRDQMTLRLAELVGATATTTTDGMVEVKLGSAVLVSGTTPSTAAPFTVTGGSSLGDRLTLTIGATDVTDTVVAGTVGGVKSLIQQDGTLHTSAKELDAFAASLADAVNTQHRAGWDLTGPPAAAGGDFFTSSSGGPVTAANISLAVTDPNRVAASSVPGTLDNSNADALAALSTVDEGYRRLVTDLGAQVASSRRVAQNQRVLTDQVDASREALAGIDIDEEMVQMMAHQRAYEAAARVLTTLDSVLDTLINRTGLVR